MKLDVLHVADCPNLPPMLQRLAEVTDLPVTTHLIETDEDAIRFGMAGSPTLLINGTDPFNTGDRYGLSCRLYRDETGRIVPTPSVHQLRAAISSAGAELSAWRARAIPLDPAEKAVHQAILRGFAATGTPPTDAELDLLMPDNGRTTAEVLTALHDADAIRLSSDGRIAVAYPFSATPTRHRVQIADEVEVYAMCAIDALGIAPMLGQDIRITSEDVTTAQLVDVTITGGRSSWQPAEAVVFIGADAGGGPSADCCCNYLNFFADQAAAEAWTSTHPAVPGQILNQTDAENLATRLFQPLLTT